MKTAQSHVREFMRTFGQGIGDETNPGLNRETALLRARLMVEECIETCHALGLSFATVTDLTSTAIQSHRFPVFEQEPDMVALADGLADSTYINLGTAVAAGIDLAPVFDEVHRSNMEKASECEVCAGHGVEHGLRDAPCPHCNGTGRIVNVRDDGKILKPEGWQPPDIEGVLRRQAEALREEPDCRDPELATMRKMSLPGGAR